ncbi:gamma-glutamylcyclotransferase [Burkholderiales bacterium]|nr:gamma-glutamylcyclotransferase [Burkholderiales bacterium]
MSAFEKTKIKRDMLEQDTVRQAVERSGHRSIMMSEADLLRSLDSILQKKSENRSIWIFGYGSLIWNPMLNFVTKQPARIHGYHRGFYCWSRINRGSPESPGLVLALDRGGSCRGLAYQLSPKSIEKELLILWRREMLGKVYVPTWVRAKTEEGYVDAITFVIDRSTLAYTGKLDEDRIVSIALGASGHYGSCSDYLIETAKSLRYEGIQDEKIFRLADKILTRKRHFSDANNEPTK